MKTGRILALLVTALFGLTSSNAQLKIIRDGGIKMGSQPSNPWTLESKGLEINLGDVYIHAPGGSHFSFSGYKEAWKAGGNIVIDPGGTITRPTVFSVLTGSGLTILGPKNHLRGV